MNFLIQNVTKNELVDRALDEILINKNSTTNKMIVGTTQKSGTNYLVTSDSITDYQIIIDLVRDLKNEFNLYIKNVDFQGSLKIFTLTNFIVKGNGPKNFQNFKKSEKVEVTGEVAESIATSIKSNMKLKKRKINLIDLVKELKEDQIITLHNKFEKLYTKATLGDEEVLVRGVNNGVKIVIKGNTFTTTDEPTKKMLIDGGLNYVESIS